MDRRTRNFTETLLSVENISLSFGGVKALTDISFDIRKGEIRAIIGPNGAGKSSMLNCINGFYHPQQGAITYKGLRRSQMRPHEAAEQGIARTFQNIELFENASMLANLLVGRHCHATTALWQDMLFMPSVRRAPTRTSTGWRSSCSHRAACCSPSRARAASAPSCSTRSWPRPGPMPGSTATSANAWAARPIIR